MSKKNDKNKSNQNPNKWQELGGDYGHELMLKLLDNHLKGCACPKCKKENSNRK